MKSIKAQEDARPIARVYFAGEGTPYPGWFVQRYIGTDLLTTRLPLIEGAHAFDAVTKAADFLVCSTAQIQVEGSAWPETAKTA